MQLPTRSTGRAGDPGSPLKDFARSWLTGRLEKKRLKPSTAAKIASVLDLHVLPAFRKFFVDAIRPPDVEKWRAHSSRAPSR